MPPSPTSPPSLPTDFALGAPRGRGVFMETLGCQMNVLDSEMMVGRLERLGYRSVPRAEDADVVLFNTCSVRQHAEDKVWSRLGALKGWKSSRPGRVLGVVGCMAQREKGHIFERAPHVDVVCGPAEIGEIDRYVRSAEEGAERVLATNLLREVSLEREVSARPSRFQAFVNVQRGCDRACTFCIVPTVRGRQSDRPLDDVVDEVRRLADDGCVEVTLLGQNIDAYGRRSGAGATLARLLREVARVPGLLRVRFVTSHPADMEEDLLRAMGELPVVSGYLHVPAQSGADSVLKRMARGYTRAGYLRQVELARRHVPGVEFASDFIVGFPGETDAEFEATADLLAEVAFQTAFVFKYSVRDGTHASRAIPDDVPEAVKKERNQALLAIQERVSLRRHREAIGRDVEVLVEGPSARDPKNWTGRTRGNDIVVFPSSETGGADLAGRLATVTIRDATPLTLLGNLAAVPRP